MAAYTWQTPNGTTQWETPTSWDDAGNNPTGGDLETGTDDYLVGPGGVGAFTITDWGNPAHSATTVELNNANLTLTAPSNSGQVTLEQLLLTAGTIDLTGGNLLQLGAFGSGTLTIGAGGHLVGGGGAAINDLGNQSNIMGGGTVLAASGLFQFGVGVTVASGATTAFQIGNGATLEFDDTVAGGSISFAGSSGQLFLGQVLNGKFAGGNAVTGIGGNNKITVAGITAGFTLTNQTGSGADLIITDGATSETVTFSGNFIGASLGSGLDGMGNQLLTFTVCYAAGTAIMTATGETAVELLREGDTVLTSENGTLVPRKVIWTGSLRVNTARHPNPQAVAPIRFMAGALGENLPKRDLVVSPDHCMLIDGKLIPAKLLINGMTIVQELDAGAVSYHHIELAKHAILIAEGVEAESYLDTGNRSYFDNAGLTTILHPELTINEHLRCWETDACAPLAVKPEIVKPAWQRFADRAVALGFQAPSFATTNDSDIHLLVDGKMLRPLSASDRTVSFMLPSDARSIRLVSRSTRPGELTPWLDDPRTLGVAIRSVTLRDRSGEAVMGADHPALRDGWHLPETSADGAVWRWTKGDAVLPIAVDGPCAMEIALGGQTTYIETRLAA